MPARPKPVKALSLPLSKTPQVPRVVVVSDPRIESCSTGSSGPQFLRESFKNFTDVAVVSSYSSDSDMLLLDLSLVQLPEESNYLREFSPEAMRELREAERRAVATEDDYFDPYDEGDEHPWNERLEARDARKYLIQRLNAGDTPGEICSTMENMEISEWGEEENELRVTTIRLTPAQAVSLAQQLFIAAQVLPKNPVVKRVTTKKAATPVKKKATPVKKKAAKKKAASRTPQRTPARRR